MLNLVIPAGEYFNPKTNEFIQVKEKSLSLEHSLVSISKWESTWHKPFLGKEKKSKAEILDYVRCMTLTQNVNKSDYYRLTESDFAKIEAYIDDPMTATTFTINKKNETPSRKNSTVITNEIIYYWMIEYGVPMECQKWHLNRLLTLIRVCKINNSPKKKMSQKDLLNRNRNLNASRRKALGTRG